MLQTGTAALLRWLDLDWIAGVNRTPNTPKPKIETTMGAAAEPPFNPYEGMDPDNINYVRKSVVNFHVIL